MSLLELNESGSNQSQHELELLLCKFLEANKFNNLAVVLSWLHHQEQIATEPDAEHNIDSMAEFAAWQPDSPQMLEVWGGTNCIGMVQLFKEILEDRGYQTELAVTTSNNLPEGVSIVDVPFQHAALYVTDDEGIMYLVDPGLGLVKPIELTENSVEIAGRKYTLELHEEMQRLRVIKPSGEELHFDFVSAPPDMDLERNIQKPLLRATSVFKIDKFNAEGQKTCSIKIDLIRKSVSYFVLQEVETRSFAELPTIEIGKAGHLFRNVMAELDDPELASKLRSIAAREDDIVAIWFDELQKQYYLENPEQLSPFETPSSQLLERGYQAGGVVAVLHDGAGKVILYEVPEGMDKPQINRYSGNLNVFTETAEFMPGENGGMIMEELEPNMQRIYQEEIGLTPPEEFIYREVDYRAGSPVRARVIIQQVEKDALSAVMAYNIDSTEIGQVQWVNLHELDKQPIEPNARAILQKLLDAGVLRHA